MANTTQLKQTDGATVVKSGDFGSRFAYQLLDEHGNLMEELNGQTAGIKLVQFDAIVYERDALVENGEVAFHFDEVLPAGKYWLEIWVDGYIFPSDRETKIKVIKAAKEREVSAPESPKLPPVRDLAGNPVDKVVLHAHRGVDLSDYPTTTWIVVNPNNTLPESLTASKFNVYNFKTKAATLVQVEGVINSYSENLNALDFEVDGKAYSIPVEIVKHDMPEQPRLETTEIVLTADNGYRVEVPITPAVEGVEAQLNGTDNVIWVNATVEQDKVVFNSWMQEAQTVEKEVTLILHRDHYMTEIPLTIRVEV